jgi:hypothetical protein
MAASDRPNINSSTNAPDALHNCLHLQAVEMLSYGNPPNPKKPFPETVVGSDVAFDADRINQATNTGLVDWIAFDGLNDLVHRSYAHGKHLDQTLKDASGCAQLSKQDKLDLLRYRILHDSLLRKSKEFATRSASADQLVQHWERDGFLRPIRPPLKHDLISRIIRFIDAD